LADRNMSRQKIILRLEREANAYARRYEDERAAFGRRQRIEDMENVIEDILEWMDERGDLDRLKAAGVEIDDEEEGRFALSLNGRITTVRPREDLSLAVDGRIVHPNRDCPVLDEALYQDVITRLDDWVREAGAKQ